MTFIETRGVALPIETAPWALQEKGTADEPGTASGKASSAKRIERWPQQGRHILAQVSLFPGRKKGQRDSRGGDGERGILVYQAYTPAIAEYAVEHGKFVGAPGFSPTRMTWIKTNFLWMMYRSGWSSKPNQERIVGIWLRVEAFERYLATAVHSNFVEAIYNSRAEWQAAMRKKEPGTVRLQWDPDHMPDGSAHPGRRAVQLGLRDMASFVGGDDILEIQDVTDFCVAQHANATGDLVARAALATPLETIFTPERAETIRHLGLTQKVDTDDNGGIEDDLARASLEGTESHPKAKEGRGEDGTPLLASPTEPGPRGNPDQRTLSLTA
jgi:Domain of unknown function (DUF4291)